MCCSNMLFPHMVRIKTTHRDIQKEKMNSIVQDALSRDATAKATTPPRVMSMQMFLKSFLFPRDLYYFNKNVDVYCIKLFD